MSNDRFSVFNGLCIWEKTLVFLGTLVVMYLIACFGSLFFQWLGVFVFCSSIWLRPVRERFDFIDKNVVEEKKFESDK